MPADPLKTAVLRIDQSPMNPVRWLLTLECGHEKWVTSKKKPRDTTAKCSEEHPPK